MIDLSEIEGISIHLEAVCNLVHIAYDAYLNGPIDKADLDSFLGIYSIIEELLTADQKQLQQSVEQAYRQGRAAVPEGVQRS